MRCHCGAKSDYICRDLEGEDHYVCRGCYADHLRVLSTDGARSGAQPRYDGVQQESPGLAGNLSQLLLFS
jgi:hypothetical protein